MKRVFWTFLLHCCMNFSGFAAQGPNPANPVDAKARTHFKKWEEARSKIAHFDARVLITEKSQPSKELTWRRVSVKYLKSDNPTHPDPYLEMRLCQWPEEMPNDYLVCQDFFYVLNHEKETVQSYEIGYLETYLKKLGRVHSLFGKSHDRFRESLPYAVITTSPMAWIERYDIRFLSEDEKTVQFDVLPVAKSDRDLFKKGRLTLSKEHGLPIAIKWEEKNGTELSYDLEQIDLTRKWKPGHFRKPSSFPECAGWTFKGTPESFPEEKEDPDQAEAAPFFQIWEDALAKIDRMEATIHAKGRGDREFLDAFPLKIKYWKTSKNTKEAKNYDLSFLGKPYRETNRLISISDQFFYFQRTEKTVFVVDSPGGLRAFFENHNEKGETSSWLLNALISEFKYTFFTLTPKEILDRYHVRLTNEDDHFAYFEILPSKAKDKKVLNWASMVLDKKTYLLKKVSFESTAWNSYELDIKSVDLEAKFRPEELEAPTAASWPGWKFESFSRPR